MNFVVFLLLTGATRHKWYVMQCENSAFVRAAEELVIGLYMEHDDAYSMRIIFQRSSYFISEHREKFKSQFCCSDFNIIKVYQKKEKNNKIFCRSGKSEARANISWNAYATHGYWMKKDRKSLFILIKY